MKHRLTRIVHHLSLTAALVALVAGTFGVGTVRAEPARSGSQQRPYTDSFRLQDCDFASTGSNPYFILEPYYFQRLEGDEDKTFVELEVTVLPETETITMPGLDPFEARVVEEREWADGELAEVSRNFFAICGGTNSVYYFGEDVDLYENGEVVGHEGGWKAGEDGALPGLFMPGTFLLGSRYYQEIAPDVALDRAENMAMGLTVDTPAGTFSDAVMIFETTPLEPNAKGIKLYAPGVGLIVDETLRLVDWTGKP